VLVAVTAGALALTGSRCPLGRAGSRLDGGAAAREDPVERTATTTAMMLTSVAKPA
jgi:hypothetical protein